MMEVKVFGKPSDDVRYVVQLIQKALCWYFGSVEVTGWEHQVNKLNSPKRVV